MPIAHHHHLLGAVSTDARHTRQVRIDGLTYAATPRGSIAAGAAKRFSPFERRWARRRAS